VHVNTCTKYIFSCILLVVDCRLTIVDLDPSAMLRAGSLDRLKAGPLTGSGQVFLFRTGF